MDKSAEMNVTIPQWYVGPFCRVSPEENTIADILTSEGLENPWNKCQTKNLKNKMVGNMRTNATNVFA
jgi:hypothetical protein